MTLSDYRLVLVLFYLPFLQEDSMIFCKSSVDRGLFRADTLKNYHSEITKNPSTSQDDIFCKHNKFYDR